MKWFDKREIIETEKPKKSNSMVKFVIYYIISFVFILMVFIVWEWCIIYIQKTHFLKI